jgi:hypothetical protein
LLEQDTVVFPIIVVRGTAQVLHWDLAGGEEGGALRSCLSYRSNHKRKTRVSTPVIQSGYRVVKKTLLTLFNLT